MKRLLSFILLPVLVLACTGLAQSAVLLPDALNPYSALITVAVSVLSGLLVYPLTAIAKRLGRTQGPTTVAVSAVLSLAISGGYALYQAASTHQGPGLWAALLNAGLAFLVANGLHLGLVGAASKGAAGALPPVIITAAPQQIHPYGTPGTEPLHDEQGRVVGAVKPLDSSDGLERAK